MSKGKKDVREQFKEKVFKRDKNSCKLCGDLRGPHDAHHIIDRHLFANGGYVLENGITLCPPCHKKAEEQLKLFLSWKANVTNKKYGPLNLYELIKSSYDKAKEKDSLCSANTKRPGE